MDDSARLDFVLENSAFVMVDKGLYQLWTQDEDEYFIILHGNSFHKTARQAIDAAISTPEENRTRYMP